MSGLISVDEALRTLAPHALDAGEEAVLVADALGRILARDVAARTTTPPADVSAMDGYAVRFSDVRETGNRLQVTGEIPAGTLPDRPVAQGEAMRIFTGAPLPDGADHILIQEEAVPVGDALGRVLARDVTARTTTPPADVSAMDGYAVRLSDVRETGNRLQVTGEIPAGTLPDRPVAQGEAMRIFTGAPLPDGADHILIQEEAARAGDTIEVTAAQTAAKHIRKAGRDFSEGEILIAAGTRLSPADLGLAAAGNNATITVRRKPKVAILPGGDELRPPGSKLEPGQIIDSNSTAMAALVRSWGGEPVSPGIAGDTIEQIRALIDAASDADLIIPIGGASVGDYDYMKAAFQEAGVEILFSGIAVRPGKPTWFAKRGGQLVLGLPGNPASAFVCAHLFLKGLLVRTAGSTDRFTAKLEAGMAPGGSRETYYRAVARPGEGGLTAAPLPDQDSSLLRPLQTANCLICRLPDAPAAGPGDEVECVSLGGPF